MAQVSTVVAVPEQNVFAMNEQDAFSVELKAIGEQLQTLLPNESRETVDRCLDLYGRNEFVIMVAGEISVGKSSFLNALIGQSVLLTDTTETTAAITYLRTAEGVPGVRPDHVKITYRDGNVEWISMHDKKRLTAATTSLAGNMKAISRVRSAEVYFDPKTLSIPKGITIIDTPGLNGSDSHAELTHREMGLCHAAIFLLDATKFGTLSNQEEFAKLYRYAPEVLFVINKWDLVRSTGCNLQDVKKDTYFPKLGNWASRGEITDENIFVISGGEALETKARYAEKMRAMARLPKRQQKDVPYSACMPYRDNEYFFLESRLRELMADNKKVQMIRRRPLQTMLQLAIDCEGEYQDRSRKYLESCKELEEHIRLEAARIDAARDEAERVFNEVRDFAQRLVMREVKVYRQLIADASEKIESDVMDVIGNTSAGLLCTDAGQEKISAHVKTLVEQHYRKPVVERFSAFVDYIKSKLQSNATVNTDDGVSILTSESLANDIAQMDREKKAMERQIAASGTKREVILGQISKAKSAIKDADEQIKIVEEEEKEYCRLSNAYDAAVAEKMALGARPAAKRKYITKTVTVRKEGGWGRKALSFLTFGLVDDYYEEEEERTVEIRDDSAGKRWDEQYAEINGRVDAAKRRRDAAKPDYAHKTAWERTKQEQERILARSQDALRKNDEEVAAQRASLQRLGAGSAKKIVRDYWVKELPRIRQSFETAVQGFRGEIDLLLQNFWRQRADRIEKYVADMRVHERELDEQRKKESGDYKAIQDGLRLLARIKTVLESELNKLEKEGI